MLWLEKQLRSKKLVTKLLLTPKGKCWWEIYTDRPGTGNKDHVMLYMQLKYTPALCQNFLRGPFCILFAGFSLPLKGHNQT